MSTPLNRFLQIHHLLRGADTYSNNPKSPVYDSSPHARGRPTHRPGRQGLGWFITSCEGQTFHTSHTTRHSQIHPLQRGANPQSAFRHLLLYEKSPPARGKLAAISHVWHNFRIIPSYEGQTCLVYVDKMTNAIHPLIRGANVQFLSWILFVIDSSPHTRGKQFVFFRNFPTIRFIPSREGKTSANPRGKVRAKIHPLPRGENPQCLWGF